MSSLHEGVARASYSHRELTDTLRELLSQETLSLFSATLPMVGEVRYAALTHPTGFSATLPMVGKVRYAALTHPTGVALLTHHLSPITYHPLPITTFEPK